MTGFSIVQLKKLMGQGSSITNKQRFQNQAAKIVQNKNKTKFCQLFKISPKKQEDDDIPEFEEDLQEDKNLLLLRKTSPLMAKKVKTKLFLSGNHKNSRFIEEKKMKGSVRPLLKWNQFTADKKNKCFTDSYIMGLEIYTEKPSIKYYKVFLKSGKLQRVAKIIKRNEINEQQEKQVLNQIAILPRINHSNIARLIEIYISQNQIVLIFENLEGSTLKVNAKQKKIHFCERKVHKIMMQLFRAINYLHNFGISHRNIQLKNIYLNKDCSHLKLIGFSRASYFSTEQPNSLNSDRFSKQKITDIWSAGVVLFMLIAGYQQFQGQSIKKVIVQIQQSLPYLNQQKSNFSFECFDLLRNLTERKMMLTSNIVLDHPWFQNLDVKNILQNPTKKIGLQNFKKFKENNALEVFVKTYIIQQLASSKQIVQYLPLFEQIDINNKGVIEYEQFRSALATPMDKKQEQRHFVELFELLDTNKTGKLQFTEFIVGVIKFDKNSLRKYLQIIFTLLDEEGYGQIDFFNIRKYLDRNILNLKQLFYSLTGESRILTKDRFIHIFSDI